MSTATDDPDPGGFGRQLTERLLSMGVDGIGPVKGAEGIADEVRATSPDTEEAVRRLIATQRRLVGAGGFAFGLGGFPSLPFTLPADLMSFYLAATRMSAGIAHLRGYNVRSDEVRSLVLVSLLGSSGAALLLELGVDVATKSGLALLKRLPGSILIEINKRVGFRLITKFGEKGAVNLVKVLPVVGGVVGAGVNTASITVIAKYAKRTFPPLQAKAA